MEVIPSVLLVAKETPSGANISSLGVHNQPLSASGFFLGPLEERTPSLVVSSASWLSSMLDIALDGTSGVITWSWKKQPHPQFVILYGEEGKAEPFIVNFLGIYLMPSVLSSLKRALSSLIHWRASISSHSTNDETTDHLPLEHLLLPLACVTVFNVNLPTTTQRTVQLCNRCPTVGGKIVVTATPFGSYCPEVFLNSVMSGCVSKLLGPSGCVFLIDASTVPGCEGGAIVHKQCSRSLISTTRVCGMVLSSLHTDQGQPTGLSLACSSSAIVDAVQQLKPIFSTRSIIDNSTLEGLEHSSLFGELEKLIVLVTTRAGWGSGIVLTPSLVLTCNHVVTNSRDADIKVHNTITKETISASVAYSSSIPDLAVICLDQPIQTDNVRQLLDESQQNGTLSKMSELYEGIDVIVIGFGLQHTSTNVGGPLLSRGVVSKVVCDKIEGQPVLFVTTAAVNPGMSGGLVANAKTGQLLGLVVSNSQTEENRKLYPKINYCLPLSWLLPALASYALEGDVLKLNRLAKWGQKVKHIWQLQSNLDIQHLILTSKL